MQLLAFTGLAIKLFPEVTAKGLYWRSGGRGGWWAYFLLSHTFQNQSMSLKNNSMFVVSHCLGLLWDGTDTA